MFSYGFNSFNVLLFKIFSLRQLFRACHWHNSKCPRSFFACVECNLNPITIWQDMPCHKAPQFPGTCACVIPASPPIYLGLIPILLFDRDHSSTPGNHACYYPVIRTSKPRNYLRSLFIPMTSLLLYINLNDFLTSNEQ